LKRCGGQLLRGRILTGALNGRIHQQHLSLIAPAHDLSSDFDRCAREKYAGITGGKLKGVADGVL
jgi:hypothetical protein